MDYLTKLQFFNGGRWFRFPKDFLKILPFRESIILAALINKASLEFENMDEEGYFLCSNKQIMKELDLSRNIFEKSLTTLKKKKIINSKLRKSTPPKRLLYIDVNRIAKEIENKNHQIGKFNSLRSEGIKSLRSEGIGISPKGDISKKELCRKVLRPCTNNSKYHKWANNFASKICKVFNKKESPDINQWATDIRCIHIYDKQDDNTIQKVLRWYCKQFDKTKHPYNGSQSSKYLPPYVPVALSAKAFRSKFISIEMAMMRQSQEIQKESPDIKLSKYDKRQIESMKINMDYGGNKDIVIGWEILVQSITHYKKHIEEQLEQMQESNRELYLRDIFNAHLHQDYTGWISMELGRWTTWGNDLKIFIPGGKHWKRYMDWKLQGFSPKQKTRELFYKPMQS